MIERLEIRNFQPHRELAIDFAPGVTTIVGASDVGKSAAIRAYRWAAENEWDGVSDITHGETECEVVVIVDGHRITRRRTSSENVYELDGQIYKAFGADVPEPIKRLLNLGPTNWQGQHDAHYWFSETAGEVSRQLNAVVDLGVIDTTLAAAASGLKESKADYEAKREANKRAKAKVESLAWVEQAQAALAEVAVLEKRRDTSAWRRGDLSLATDQIKGHDAEVTRLQAAAKALAAVAVLGRDAGAVAARRAGLGVAVAQTREAAKNAATWATAGDKLLAVARLGRDAATVGRRLDGLMTVVGELRTLDDAVAPDTTELEAAYDRYIRAARAAGMVQRLCDDLIGRIAEVSIAEAKAAALEDQMGDTCPVCGGQL